MAKAAKKKLVRREYTKEDVKTLKEHSKAQTPLEKISKAMKRTAGAPEGHQARHPARSSPSQGQGRQGREDHQGREGREGSQEGREGYQGEEGQEVSLNY